MTAFLVIVLGTLFSGLSIVMIMSWYRPQLAAVTGAIAMTVVLALWVMAGRNLPLSFSSLGPSSSLPWPQCEIYVDDVAWEISFYLLLLVVAILVVMMSQPKLLQVNKRRMLPNRLLPSAIVFAALTTLITLWTSSLSGLVVSWTLLAISWLFLLWAVDMGSEHIGTLITRFVFLLPGVLFLGMAAVSLGGPEKDSLNNADWSGAARIWSLLASLWFLGVFPFHWWRAINRMSSRPAVALVYLIPAVTGGSLIVRLASVSGGNGDYELFMTMLGLLSLLAGVSIAWTNLVRPGSLVSALSISQSGIIILVASWAGSEGIVAEIGVMVLAIGGLYLLTFSSRNRTGNYVSWLGILYLAAIAGLPLTLGFLGRSQLYDAWLAKGRLLLVLVSGLIYVLITAVGFSFARGSQKISEKKIPTTRQLQSYTSLLLLAVGLLALPEFSLAEVSPITWLVLILSAAGGLVLSRYGSRVSGLQKLARRAIYFQLPLARVRHFLIGLGETISTTIRDAVAILEGEGGMLWLIILVIVLWLARRS